jgi:UDP-N-acetylglucosamine 2-epimerase (non-hydrolysing)
LNICNALAEIGEDDDIQVIYPVHLNPNVQTPVRSILQGRNNIALIDPVDYPSFVWLMQHSYLILTDSGGVQEEAPSLGSQC